MGGKNGDGDYAKLLARLVATGTAALRVWIQAYLKNNKWATLSKGVANALPYSPHCGLHKNIKISFIYD